MCKEWFAKPSPLPKIVLRSAILPVSFDMLGREVPLSRLVLGREAIGGLMEHVSVSPPLWISGTDENGKLVSREVIQAAHRIWTRVLQHLRYHAQDTAPAAEILESACHCVSRAI